MDDGSGQTVRDIGPNALNGTLGASTAVETTDPTWTSPGRFGPTGLTALAAQSQYVYVNHGVPFPNNALTFEAWFKPADAGYAQIFTAGFINLFVAVQGSGIEWGVGDGSGWQIQDASAPISAGAWHYVAVTFDGATLNAYLDGAHVGSTTGATTLAAPTEYYIGGRPSNTFLNGVLGPQRLSSTAHTAATIGQVWADATPCPAP
jgi:hypothetical protein